MANFFRSIIILTGWTILVAGTVLITPLWTKKKFACEGTYVNQRTSDRRIAKASFEFQRYSKFAFWTDRFGQLNFELHEPEKYNVYSIYEGRGHKLNVTGLGSPEELKGQWSTISGRFTVNLGSGHEVFEGFCTPSS